MILLATTTHFAINKDAWLAGRTILPFGLSVEEVKPQYGLFERLMVRVGAHWGWDKRYTHVRENAFWRAAMNDAVTRLFILKRDRQEIGLCLAIRPRSDAAPYLTGEHPIEIKYFGLFIEETGHGYGGPILQELFARLFERHDEIYLSTRSSNHEKVVSFYQKMGMHMAGQELQSDDVIVAEESAYQEVS